MLVLSRKRDEVIVIGEGAEAIRITVTQIKGGQVKLGFEAPPGVSIMRSELLKEENK